MTQQPTPPPLSKRDTRRQDRRDCILTVAQAYFLEHGYAGTTMSGIAAALGGSKGTLWNHFPSKSALFAAVLERVATRYQARLSQILDPAADLEATLMRACISLIEKVTSAEAIALHRLIIAESGRFPELSTIFFDLAPENTRGLLAAFLDGAMASGRLRPADPMDAARMMIAVAMSGTHNLLLMGQIAKPSPARIQADAALAVETFLRAYAPVNRA